MLSERRNNGGQSRSAGSDFLRFFEPPKRLSHFLPGPNWGVYRTHMLQECNHFPIAPLTPSPHPRPHCRLPRPPTNTLIHFTARTPSSVWKSMFADARLRVVRFTSPPCVMHDGDPGAVGGGGGELVGWMGENSSTAAALP